MAQSTLQELLDMELQGYDESPSDLIRIEIDRPNTSGLEFDDLDAYSGDVGFGAASLPNMYAWTEERVYFKHVYDGAESVYSIPRDPSDETPRRVG